MLAVIAVFANAIRGNILQNKKSTICLFTAKQEFNGLFIIAMENGTAFKIFLPNVV